MNIFIPDFLEVKNLGLLDLKNNTEGVKYVMSYSCIQWKNIYSLEKAQRLCPSLENTSLNVKVVITEYKITCILAGIKKVLVAQSCQTLCDPMDCNLAGSSVHGILSGQEYWSGKPLPFSGNLSNPRADPGLLYCRQILYHLSPQGSPVHP